MAPVASSVLQVASAVSSTESVVTLDEWLSFLDRYAHGDWATVSDRPASPLPTSSREQGSQGATPSWMRNGQICDDKLYADTGISKDTARTVAHFVSCNDYLPPPPSPIEHLRQECIGEYDIHGPTQTAIIQSAVELTAAFYSNAIITFTLFDGRSQSFVAMDGDPNLIKKYGLELKKPIPAYNSLCGHSVLQPQSMMFIPDLANDWRTRSNPYVQAGVTSYIGSPVSLEVNPAGQDETPAQHIGIGALNILIMGTPLRELSATQRKVISNITTMLGIQLRSTWEGERRTKEASIRALLAQTIDEAFVSDQHESEADGVGPEDALKVERGYSAPGNMEEKFERLAQDSLDRAIHILVGIDLLILVNLGGAGDTSSLDLPSTSTVARKTGLDWTIPQTIHRDTLVQYRRIMFGADSLSGLECHLPASANSHMIMPFFASENPLLVLIAASSKRHIPSADIAALRSIGSLLKARLLQNRVIQADSAKTAFLSSISHELRTPMHSMLVGVGLARAAAELNDMTEVRSSLEDVALCGYTLKTIVNDVLDFGRSATLDTTVSKITRVDLVQSIKEASATCLPLYQDFDQGFSLILDVEQRDWNVSIDDAKFRRIVINGLTNALKFCKNGIITILLTAGNHIVLSVRDEGIGFDESEVPHLLAPFTKIDPHSPGAGLGLHITRQLAHEMGGELKLAFGQGTTFIVDLPLTFVKPIEKRVVSIAREILIEGSPPMVKNIPFQALNLGSRSIRVLIVDDNTLCRRILVKSLQKGLTPVQTCEAADGKSAVDRFQEFHPHLVLTDVSMPIMDGVTSAGLMRGIAEERDWQSCRIYALTGLGSTDPRLKTIGLEGKASLDGWLVKGQDDMAEIRAILEEIYQGHSFDF